MLQKKWKSLRDNFARELKRQNTRKSGSAAKYHTPYIYFTRLRFLENSVSNKETTSNFDEDTAESETQESADSDLLSGSTRETFQTQNVKKKIKLNPVDQHFSDILTKSIQAREKRETEQNNQDEDKLFCLSLYKELQKVPEQGRIKTKIELLQVIQKAQDCYSPVQPHFRRQPYQFNQPFQNITPNSSYMASQLFTPLLSTVSPQQITPMQPTSSQHFTPTMQLHNSYASPGSDAEVTSPGLSSPANSCTSQSQHGSEVMELFN